MPAAGRASGRPPASVILMNLEAALTFVARFWRPFLSVRPSYSSLPAVPASTTSLYVWLSAPASSPPAFGSSVISTLMVAPLALSRASALKASTVLSAAAGSAATARPSAPSAAPTRTTQQRPPPFWKKP